jgi:predicted porin
MTSGLGRSATLLAAAVIITSLPATSLGQIPGNVKFYGFLNAEVERVWASGGTTPYDARFRVTDGNSRLGVAGSFDLREGTQALWQIEAGFNGFEQGGSNDKGQLATITSRNTFVGVADRRFGHLTVGYVDSAYRSLVGSGSEMGGNLGLTRFGLDLWNNTSAQMTGNSWSVFSRGEARLKNSVHYLSPEGPIRGGISYGIDEGTSTKRARDRLSAGLRFKWEGLMAGVGYDYQRNTGLDTDKLEQGLGAHTDGVEGVNTYYFKALAGYTLETTGTYLGVGWERAGYGYAQFVPADPSTPLSSIHKGTLTQDAVMASVAQSVGDLSVMLSAGKLLKLKGAGAVFGTDGAYEASQLSFGVKYALTGTFATYAYYTAIQNKKQQDANLGQAPLYSNGQGTSDAYLAPGNSPRAFGLGLIARF